MQSIRVYEIPACRMASSEAGMFGDGVLERFSDWFSTLPRTMFPRDFLWFDGARGGFVWYYMLEEGAEAPAGFGVVDFPGGLYAVATGIDQKDNTEAMEATKRFIEESGCFEIDPARESMGNIITSPAAQAALGYNQMDYYTPIRIKGASA